MIIGKKKLTVITILDSALGVGTSLKDNEQAHHCPFCHHPKKKLQINLENQKKVKKISNYHTFFITP